MPTRLQLVVHVRMMIALFAMVLTFIAAGTHISPAATLMGAVLALAVWLALEKVTETTLQSTSAPKWQRLIWALINLFFLLGILSLVQRFQLDSRGLIVGVSALPLGAISGAVVARLRAPLFNSNPPG